MVVGFQETRFRIQWHCYYTRQVRRIPVSIPRSSSGYNYQYLYLYNIKPAEVISGTHVSQTPSTRVGKTSYRVHV